MATFLLVHGSWHGGWCWQRLAPVLRAADHDVVAPTLTGMGERAHTAPAEIRLATHVEDVLRVMTFEDLRDVVLVGHSYAGMIITGVAARDASRLRSLVYLDAYLPDPGQSEHDLWPADMAAAAAADMAAGRKHRTTPPPSFFGLEGADAAWAAARLTPQPLAVYLDPASMAPLPPIPARFIHCTRGPIADVFGAFAARARARGWPVDEIATGHDAMLTMPEELAKLLLRAA
ncbi:MAG TPA: alpha/beta hydrolase family protein [Candidatus Thermoplasmatota archaeon]|jgi:pimeloyl-ACP methyl ester carboxylesterase|nr:alpha/beta hydrolase family protein [Candidatus Thermoplasmatota archaeon]